MHTQEEHMAHGATKCPYCNSEDIQGHSVNIDAGTAWQDVECNECGQGWHDIYTLTSYEPDNR
jgi:transcription elongation factor Elf1